jgi:hypothetical protein
MRFGSSGQRVKRPTLQRRHSSAPSWLLSSSAERLGWAQLSAAALMAGGTWLLLGELHAHVHVSDAHHHHRH